MAVERVSTEVLTASFAGTTMPSDPTFVGDPDPESAWSSSIIEEFGVNLKPAGVLIPVLNRPDGFAVLLTQRSRQLKHHAGQVSFPGGRMERCDASIVATALRETHEEVGIDPAAVSVIGCLRPTPTLSGYAVTPAIGFVDTVPPLLLDPGEVAAAFEVPLSYLLDASVYRHSRRDYRGISIPMLEFDYAGHRVWGATAMIISTFINRIKNNSL